MYARFLETRCCGVKRSFTCASNTDLGAYTMFINFVEFPPIKEGKEQEFKDWFKESNEIFSKFDGFISRRLLVSSHGSYAGLVEHESKETFMKMHSSKEQGELHAKAATMMSGEPKAGFYEVVEL